MIGIVEIRVRAIVGEIPTFVCHPVVNTEVVLSAFEVHPVCNDRHPHLGCTVNDNNPESAHEVNKSS